MGRIERVGKVAEVADRSDHHSHTKVELTHGAGNKIAGVIWSWEIEKGGRQGRAEGINL